MENCRDFVDYLGPDTSVSVLALVGDPADLVRATSVSRSWRRFIISNGFLKKLCSRMCPEVSNFAAVYEVVSSEEVRGVEFMEWEILEREHRAYAYLSHCLISAIGRRDCVIHSIGASSTDYYPEESIEHTLEPNDRDRNRPSYWSSGGQSDPEVPETLTYKLCSNLCVVNGIMIRPFEAYFQPGQPIYSAKFVQFRMGHSRLSQEKRADYATSTTDSDEYVWTYISPKFPMQQENVLQPFKLPRPVLCNGGIFQIELWGRVQKQQVDDLYYICVCHVRVIGRPLMPVFDADIIDNCSGRSVLKYFPAAQQTAYLEEVSEGNEVISHDSNGMVWNEFIETFYIEGEDSDWDEDEDEDEDVEDVL